MSARDGRQSPSRGELAAGIGLANLGGCDNPAPTARRNNAAWRMRAQRKAPHASHATFAKAASSMTAMRVVQAEEYFESESSDFRKVYVARKMPNRSHVRSEAPALCVTHQEIAKRLHPRHRFELFRID